MSEIIECNQRILNGKPVFKGTRIPISLVYELLSLDYSIEDILEEYPTLSRKKILQVIQLGYEAIQ